MKKILRNTREVRDKSKPVCTARHTPRTPAAKFRFRYNIRLKFIGTEAGAGGVNLTECFGISEPNAKVRNIHNRNELSIRRNISRLVQTFLGVKKEKKSSKCTYFRRQKANIIELIKEAPIFNHRKPMS
ncbi:hypothetical protein EVAR_85476_1 [Eumeta japonica]|uniref:Uncharacterized protein n=1 Tax=Eumeta variegata TaxID=151549 RepID=A0A4C1VC80_EUMVA|nr:hypothetical protein EVAR_85476_1 [Eumeta japonica]